VYSCVRNGGGVTIERVIVKNYRKLRCTDIKLLPDLNIIVGDNESGKSTLLEAINLALKGQINRRPAQYELHPFLFNTECVDEFIENQKSGKKGKPPEILIELYFAEHPSLADLKGTINSLKEDCPGVSLTIQLDDEHFSDEYSKYIEKPDDLRSIPIEYYEVLWQSFAGNLLDTRSMPIRSAIIDPASISNTYGANRYIVEIMEDYLSKKAKVDLALSYRKMRDQFLGQEKVSEINVELKKRGEAVSDKTLSLALDMTTRAGWETGVIPHLDNIPLPLVGRGEQNSIKIKLAMEGAEAKDACKIFLVEEPENHLSHTNLNRLIEHLATRASGKQLIVTTHSSFVLNKLGVDSIKMFNGSTAVSLSDLTDSTKAYFRRLPGHDTLRMILAKRTILVEGPSDELVVTKAFYQKHGKAPLQAGVEVISVNSLAFKRFLEIAKSLNLQTSVVTDNDGDAAAVKEGYAEYSNDNIRICYSTDNLLYTLETHLCRLNSRDKLNGILGKHFEDDEKLLEYMLKNKTECALKILESKETISIPEYIQDAIK
jgi:putative ATP-dependent endonuclease of the OLD family